MSAVCLDRALKFVFATIACTERDPVGLRTRSNRMALQATTSNGKRLFFSLQLSHLLTVAFAISTSPEGLRSSSLFFISVDRGSRLASVLVIKLKKYEVWICTTIARF